MVTSPFLAILKVIKFGVARTILAGEGDPKGVSVDHVRSGGKR
jgi:hypothetical protein